MRALLLGLLGVVWVSVGTASAATLSMVDNPVCAARLSEQIVAGDLQQVQSVLSDIKRAPRQRHAICLDSPGGNLLEATKIATFVEENRIGTVIDDGATCLSACSIIFMLGAKDGPGELTADIGDNRILLEFNRRLHVNASLGFHRPDFTPKERDYSAAELKQSFDLAINATLEFVRVANLWKHAEGAPAIRADLLEKMLFHKGQDFFLVDTVDKAGRWDIDVFGYDPPVQPGAREALNACDNLSNWTASLAPTPVENADTTTLQQLTSRYAQRTSAGGVPADTYSPIFSVFGRDALYYPGAGTGERYCQVYFDNWTNSVTNTRHLTVAACGGDSVLATSFFEYCAPQDRVPEMAYFGALAVFPSDTKLHDLPEISRRITVETTEIETALMPFPGLSCGIAEDHEIAVVAPQGHVLFHETNDPEAPPVAKAENFVLLERGTSTGRLAGDPAQQDACFEACTTYRPELPEAERLPLVEQINACFNADVVWWSARMRDGTDGWASAKYLR